ncbi:MAG: 3-oxoacyl-[acyl-carrier-protein] reductase FabG [Alphaproteobacteria bacterium MarineAlpha5_Bin5]|nr:MAG: 3-oxoacyl-[acyl-carrier-protein] reductase FabG [Alphaproteobacteria bacterium MarineAlpha5_Bin5]PPR52532.1 MAG: 3-oxoacyl-[acyl-carrier-protein] reductase FabG [Alphaproteobacteria bacterium MarineAlpha5_Bin4]|tara:strand:+ start:2470 stop:3168 length:699 start_codon:yes stop_codon:yes gene_type:complete
MKKIAAFIASGSGMGADAAKHLSSKGYEIGIMSSSGKGEELAKKLNGVGFTGSNLSTKDIENFINKVSSKFGKIDVLVNSAGHGPKGEILEISDDEWISGMEVYFLNVVRPIRLVTPIMQKQKNGSIINISTFATFEPESAFPTSGVFRAGLASFIKLYSNKYAKDNIRINNILPGFIDSLPEKEIFKKRIPLQRYGKVSEISAVVELLASEGGSYITGQNIRVDGGITKSV